MRRRPRNTALKLSVPLLLAAPLALAGGWLAYSQFVIDHELALPKAIDADLQLRISPQFGLLGYYRAPRQQSRPLVLLHSINAAASSYEMRPLFEHYRKSRSVFALDLPGFGFSERSQRDYTPELYERAILEFLETEVQAPADVVALSLSCEFAARAALAAPQRFHSLACISPSGLNAPDTQRSSQRASEQDQSAQLHRALSFPLWARPLYDLIVTRPSIHYFLAQSFVGEVDAGLAAYDYLSAHQPGAQHAPLSFISGKLFTREISTQVYERLRVPVLVLYDQDAFVRFDQLPVVMERNANWRAARIQPSKGLPHFEKQYETVSALDQFWAEHP